MTQTCGKAYQSHELENLIFSGAFDCFGNKKKELVEKISNERQVFMQYINKVNQIEEYDLSYLKEKELEVLGYNFKYNLFTNVNILENKYKTCNIRNMKLYNATG